MKRCNMENAVIKMLFLATGLILTCVVISIGVMNLRQGTELANAASSRLNDYTISVKESDIMMYDGLYVRGADVINFYKKHISDKKAAADEGIALFLDNGYGRLELNGISIEEVRNNSASCYINPTGAYTGSVVRNGNGVIIEVIFKKN